MLMSDYGEIVADWLALLPNCKMIVGSVIEPCRCFHAKFTCLDGFPPLVSTHMHDMLHLIVQIYNDK